MTSDIGLLASINLRLEIEFLRFGFLYLEFEI